MLKMKKYLPLSFVFAAFVLVAYLYHKDHDRKVNKSRSLLRIEYPELSPADSIAGRILNVYHGNMDLYRNYPYQAYITFYDGKKYSITADIILPEASLTIDEVITRGDSLLKYASESSFTILKNGSRSDTARYTFKLRVE